MKTNKILVPLDGSDMAEAAVDEALQLARPDSMLVLLRAAEARTLPGADVIAAQIAAVGEAETYMAALKGTLEKRGVRQVETHVWYGSAAAAILEAARVNKVDLIVMTTHGRSGLGRLIFGSVAESVLRGTTVPILLVRPTGAPVEHPTEHGEARPVKSPEPATGAEVTR